jgi:hypothetical protein
MFYLFEFCLKNMWNCSLTQQILSHSFYRWKLYELFLLSGFLICHAVGWYIALKNQKFWWRIPERKILIIDNTFVFFGGTLFQQVVGIPMGTNYAPLLADLFLYSYESEFLQKLVKDKKIQMEDTWEKDLDFRLSKRSLKFFKIHMWFMPLRE